MKTSKEFKCPNNSMNICIDSMFYLNQKLNEALNPIWNFFSYRIMKIDFKFNSMFHKTLPIICMNAVSRHSYILLSIDFKSKFSLWISFLNFSSFEIKSNLFFASTFIVQI
jgi:hypothetical protein